MLHELEKELTRVQTTLLKKEMEFEKQQLMTTELEMTLRGVKQNTCQAECGALQAEIEKLKDFLEDAQQQQRMAGEAPASAAHHTPNTRGWSPFLSLNGHPPLPPHVLTSSLPLISSHISAWLHSPPTSPSVWNLHHIAGVQFGRVNCPLFPWRFR